MFLVNRNVKTRWRVRLFAKSSQRTVREEGWRDPWDLFCFICLGNYESVTSVKFCNILEGLRLINGILQLINGIIG